MAQVYRLDYTAEEINYKLGQICDTEEDIIERGYTLTDADLIQDYIWTKSSTDTPASRPSCFCTRKFTTSKVPKIYYNTTYTNCMSADFWLEGVNVGEVVMSTLRETWTVDFDFDAVAFNFGWGAGSTASNYNISLIYGKTKDEALLEKCYSLTNDDLIRSAIWTASSTDTPVTIDETEFCTRKFNTTKVPSIKYNNTSPYSAVFWCCGAPVGEIRFDTSLNDLSAEPNFEFNEVAFNFRWGGNNSNPASYYSLRLSLKDYMYNKVLVLGDSISTDYYGNYTKWVTVLQDDGFLPLKTTNDSIHATGFVARYTGEDENATNDFINRIETVANKESYNLVVVFGGINDYIQAIPLGESGGDKTQYFKPAVDYFFEYLITNFTQARIVVISPLRTYNVYANTAGVKQEEYAEYIRTVAKHYCLPILNLTEESGFYPFVESFQNMWTYTGDGTTGDGVHPNEEYSKNVLAPMIKNFLCKFK